MANSGVHPAVAANDVSVRTAAFNILMQRRPRALLSHYFVALLPLSVGSTPSAWRLNLVYVGLLLIYATLAILAARRYNRRPASDELAERSRRGLFAQLVFLGLLHNLVFIHLELCHVPHAMDYLLMVSAAYCAGAAGAYQHVPGLGIAFIASIMAPQGIYYLVTAERGGGLMSLLIGLFILFMSGISRDLSHDGIRRLELTQALTLEKAKAETLARTDALTALLNRRALMEVGLASFANAVRHDRPFSVVMLDVDHFKRTNDRWGHSAGDVVLVGVADTVRSVIRTADLAGRIGGEEFAIFLPDTDAPGAVALAERLRLAVSDHQAEYEGQAIAITISLGVAERTPQDDSLEPIMRRADTALYEAKKNGRNRTRVRAA